MDDLSLVTTDELLEELSKRCDNGVIILQLNRAEDACSLAAFYYGDGFNCLGLLDYMRGNIKRDIRSGECQRNEL